MVTWLNDAVFYEIYPQSFDDTNDDGIGDIQGIIEKLDYIHELGCNALWINPVYDSPFRDGGYDVRDYYKIAPRYGTNEDMIRLFQEAHKRNMKVLMDLVPGHTSDEHEWFIQSKMDEHNRYAKRYVWTNGAFVGIADHPYISGMTQREGAYMLNFFASQPALNYGWGVVTESWQSKSDSPEAIATKEALKDIMRFWLDQGCDGFRCDMADSLVKNDDDDKHATAAIWRDIRSMLDQEYPEAALVAEWSNPKSAIRLGGFHMDFYLDHIGNGYHALTRSDAPIFAKNSDVGFDVFLKDYLPKYGQSYQHGYISMFTCNHDTPRLSNSLTIDEILLFYAFLFTMPGVPFLYYGDEIGMRYLHLESVEGGYHRTGSRTPMQWSHDKNYGFSNHDSIYIKQDTSDDAPVLSDQINDQNSLYSHVRKWIEIRHMYPSLHAENNFECVKCDRGLLVYRRHEMICIVLTHQQSHDIDFSSLQIIESEGNYILSDNILHLDSPCFILCKDVINNE